MKLEKKHGIFMAIIACFLWSTAFAGVKIGYRHMPAPFTFAGLRFTLAGLLLIPFAWKRDVFEKIKTHIEVIAYVVILNTAIGYAIYYTALKYVAGATASIVVGTGPLITAIMTHYLMEDEKLTRKTFLSIMIGISGILVIVLNSKPVTAVGKGEILGIFLMLCNSTMTSYANIKVAKIKGGIDGKFLTSNQLFWGGLILLGMGRIFEGPQNLMLPLEFYLALLWLAFVSAVAFSLWFIAIQIEGMKVSELNMWKFLIPVLGAVITWVILPEESPTKIILIGMALVMTSLIMYTINNKKEKLKKIHR